MTNFPNKLIPIINAIQKASAKQDIKSYLFGSPVNFALTGKNAYSKDRVVEVHLICSKKFNVITFYDSLINFIAINREVENNSENYVILSNPYIINFKIHNDSAIEQIQNKKTTGLFYNDAIAYDIDSDSFIDINNSLNSNILKSKKTISNFSVSEIFNLVLKLGQGYLIDPSDLKELSNIRISNLQEPSGGYAKILLEILLSHEPGTCLKFIKDTFSDSKKWLFKNIINAALDLNISLSEDVNPEAILSEKRFELINAYSDFYCNHTGEIESESEKKERLATTMRLLFDSPNINITTPFINSISVLSAEMESMSVEMSEVETIQLFAVPPGCEYGQCPPCNPVDCLNQGKSPCCCCDSSNIITEVQFRCHQGVVLSCNVDATSSGPNEDPFPAECPECIEACETILGLNDKSQYNCDDLIDVGLSEGWWDLPLQFSPCSCECKQGDPDNCELTCVTCAGLYCQSEVTVTGGDCKYRIDLTPGNGCCGAPAIVDWMFVIDISGSMAAHINNVKTQIDTLIDNFADRGATVRMGLTTFGQEANNGAPSIRSFSGSSFTDSKATFVAELNSIVTGGGSFEPDIESVAFAATQADWGFASANYIMLICDEVTQPIPLTLNLDDVVDALNYSNIVVYVVDNISPQRLFVATNTNGSRFDIGTSFSDVANQVDVNVFPTSCDCIDSTPIPLRQGFPECKCCQDNIADPCIDDPTDFDCLENLPEHCYNIPIKKCLMGTDCSDPEYCMLPNALNACGQTVLVIPQQSNIVCCSDLGLGCDCEVPSIKDCCGPTCPGMEVCDQNGNPLYNTLKEAQDAVWCECFAISSIKDDTCTDCCCPDPEAGRGDPNYPCDQLDQNDPLLDEDPPRCCPCATSNRDGCCNCCLSFNDGVGGFNHTRCRQDVDEEVFEVWQSCGIEEPTGPVGPIEDEEFTVCEDDDCIVGVSSGPLDENRCGDAGKGCINIRHPAVTILNNGIGLVAYEFGENTTRIQIQQFKTSSSNKILPNREFNFGRLQNQSLWSNNIAKLYYYDELPQHIITTSTSVDINDPTTWGDRIAFRTGPLDTQVFPLVGEPVYGSDSIGNYLTFRVPSDVIVKDFPSSDDVYNIKWFILDKEDTGLIGDASDDSTLGKDYIIEDNEVVGEALLFDPHIYNGKAVPVAYPSIATATNYSDDLENSHFVYLVYQALEDNKWNLYLKQIRLSEYEKDDQTDDQISQGGLQSLVDLNINTVIYKIVCVNDRCIPASNNYLIKRSIVFEVLLEDGREVLNEGLSGSWGSLCLGQPESKFPKEKTFVYFEHNVTANDCPDQFGFDSIFYNWQVGNEFVIPTSINNASSLFNLISLVDDSSINIGVSSETLGGVNISSSQVDGTWYGNPEEITWSAIGSTAFATLSEFKGLDVSESILLTANEMLHCTRPVVKVDYNNDVYIVYECSEEGISETGNIISGDIQQIKIIGTNFPSTSLPIGIVEARQIDSTLNYFLDISDFTYSEDITEIGEGINQSPDIFVDLNNIIHITWQSNRDGRWEIYYTSTENNTLNGLNFNPIRITNFAGKSLQPTIDGDNFGRVYIAWHDNRFGNWEIMMSHLFDRLIEPLYQQDPYLASVRNDFSHSTGIIPLTITNDTSGTVCFSDIKVNFYSDRMLENFVLDVSQSEYPFAFNVPNVDSDDTTETFANFNSWTCQFAEDEYCDPYCHTFVCTSPEYDSELPKSIIEQFVSEITDLGFGEIIEISFRGSEVEDDSNASLQWTDWVILSSGTVIYGSLNIDAVSGRYKQVRVRVTTEVPIEPSVVSSILNIQSNDDDAFFHFTITISPQWKQTTNTLSVRASNGLSGEQRIILRFPIDAPDTITTIQDAFLTLTASTSTIGSLPVQIGLLNIDNAATLNWSSSFNPASLPSTINSINWTIPGTVMGNQYTAPDISPLIQAFVDRAGFQTGNFIGLEIKWTGNNFTTNPLRSFYANENSSNKPNLSVSYINEPSGPNDGYLSFEPETKTWVQGTNTLILSSGIDDPNSIESTTRIFLRFPVTFSGGIASAVLSLTHASLATGNIPIDVYLLDYDDASSLDFSSGFNVNSLPTRTTDKVSFVLGPGAIGGQANLTVSSLLEIFTDRPGYVSGNYIGFEIVPASASSGITMTFNSIESASNHPDLNSYVTTSITNNLNNGNLSTSSPSSPRWDYAASSPFLRDIRVGNDPLLGITASRIFMRFQINLNAGTSISNASLRLKGNATTVTNPATVRIYLLNFDDMLTEDWSVTGSSSQPPGIFDPTDPPARTASFVDYVFSSSSKDMAADITSLVQDFIDRGGYSSGNYVGLEIELISGIRRQFLNSESASSDSDRPQLLILQSSGLSLSNNDDGYLYDPKDIPQWIQDAETLRISKDDFAQSSLLRFPVGITSFDRVDSVLLKLKSDSEVFGTLHTNIYLLDLLDASDEDWTKDGFDASNLPSRSESIQWTINSTTVGSNHSVDISSLVQSFINSPGVDIGNWIGLEIAWSGNASSTSTYKSFISAELGTDNISIDYPEMKVSLDIDVQNSVDDAWIDDVIVATPTWNQYVNNLVISRNYLGNNELSNILLRFPIDLTNLANLNSASLTLSARTTTTGTFGVKVYLLDVEDASVANWNNSFNAANRPSRTGTSISYEIGTTTASQFVTITGLETLIEEFRNRSDYLAGNYIGLEIAWDELTLTDDNTRSFDSRESSIVSSGVSPYLTINTVENLPIDVYWPIDSLSIVSTSLFRFCLSPNESIIAELDLTPFTRVDKNGDVVEYTPLPIPLPKNKTHFISVEAQDDNGLFVDMSSQNRSISCFECDDNSAEWNNESCSINIQIPNDRQTIQYMNIIVSFFFDKDKTRKIKDFEAFYGNSDLNCFTVENNVAAQNQWTELGLKVKPGQFANLLLWPNLDPTVGLQCGINYYVDIKYCIGSTLCSVDDVDLHETLRWKCSCASSRWDERYEDAPQNYSSIIRWQSSGFGKSDIRLTETSSNNLNPILRVRSFGQGIVMYSTDRPDNGDVDNYKIFASAFNIVPQSNMYASGSQNINSPFSQIIHRSDIPVCKNTGACYDDNGNRIASSGLLGFNPSLEMDQFDNIFLAFEEPFVQTNESNASDCQDFAKNKSRIVKIHRCGLSPNELFKVSDQKESTPPCKSDSIVNQLFLTNYEPVFSKIVNKIRLKEQYIVDHINRNNVLSPIVNQCTVEFEIVGSPESIAVRLRNGRSGDWTIWHPFDTEIGENAITVSHQLSNGSGIKFVDFQVATVAGLTATGSASIIADFNKVNYVIKFYKSTQDLEAPDGSAIDTDKTKELISQEDIWIDDNLLNSSSNIPVASIRSPIAIDNTIIIQSSDYIYVEIIPDTRYMEQFSNISDEDKSSGEADISPRFDVISQGDDLFSLPTVWMRINGIEIFRGVFVITEENKTTAKDGLATIIPHFINDCSDSTVNSSISSEYSRNRYNIPVPGLIEEGSVIVDPFRSDRDDLGNIKHSIVVRPSEDPYLIFGNPNYRLKDE